MELETLLENFDAICELPGGVDRVRSRIWNLIIQPNFQEKHCLSSEYELVFLESLITSNINGHTPAKNNPDYWGGEIPWASAEDIGNTKYIYATQKTITFKGLQESRTKIAPANHLILCVRLKPGKLSINLTPMAINQDLRAFSFSPKVLVEYVYYFLLGSCIQDFGMFNGVKNADILSTQIPLTSISKQKEIVLAGDKVTELCDRVQAAKESRDTLHKKLGNAISLN